MSGKETGKSYYLWTIGCQMNAADSRRLAAQLEALGYAPTEQADAADIMVLNTCVIRQQAEEKILGRLGSLKTLKAERPGSVVALMGCMVGRHEAPDLAKRFPHVDVFMSPSETEPLLDFLREHDLVAAPSLQEVGDRSFRDSIQDAAKLLPMAERGRSVTAHVPVVLGCSNACSFCIIPYRRGIERSRPQAEILDEVRAFVDQGVKEIMFLGQIVDRYGKDLENGEDLAGLLTAANGISGLERIRFLTSHPNWVDDRLLDAVADLEKVCPQLEVPCQAGNDEVLERMRRGYTRDEYLRLIDRIRHRLPGAAIHTDVIVGFCGETEEQFMDTYRLVEQVRFDKMHLAKYSTRPRTVAARRFTDDVPEDEKERRRKLLDDLQKEILTERMAGLLGQEVEVLVEARQKERWYGRTPHNKIVYFDDPRAELVGRLVKVRIDWTGPYSLIGRSAAAEIDLARAG